MDMIRRVFVVFLAGTFLLAVLDWPVALAQQPTIPADYRVGPGDKVFMSVPQRADLNRELIVDDNGMVELPLIGKVSVSGLTTREIEAKLLQALRDYYPSINTVQATITGAVSQVIYVSGQVRAPGKFNFGTTVNVWEAIREAGGPLESASLDNVRIVKDRSRGGTSTIVNVLAAIEGGSIDALPELEPGDTVIVPTLDEVYTGAFGVNVIGAVLRPGVYRLQARQDLVSALLLAGGPAELAELGGVKIIRPRPDGSTTTVQVNLNDFLEHGDPFANPKLQPGDTVNIPRKNRLIQLATSDVRTMLGLVTALATTALLFITINNEINKTN
jgi:polysaccharide export outer membrane protein